MLSYMFCVCATMFILLLLGNRKVIESILTTFTLTILASIFIAERHGGVEASTVASQKEGPGFDPLVACSNCVCMGFHLGTPASSHSPKTWVKSSGCVTCP